MDFYFSMPCILCPSLNYARKLCVWIKLCLALSTFLWTVTACVFGLAPATAASSTPLAATPTPSPSQPWSWICRTWPCKTQCAHWTMWGFQVSVKQVLSLWKRYKNICFCAVNWRSSGGLRYYCLLTVLWFRSYYVVVLAPSGGHSIYIVHSLCARSWSYNLGCWKLVISD